MAGKTSAECAFSNAVARWTGSHWAFAVAAALVAVSIVVMGLQQTNLAISIVTLLMVFVLQNTPGSDLELPGLVAQAVAAQPGASKFDLAIFVNEGADRVAIKWQFKTDLFERATIERLARHFELLLRGALEDPQRPIAELRLVEESRRRPRRVSAAGIDLSGHAPDREAP